jgi:hypothetical protein
MGADWLVRQHVKMMTAQEAACIFANSMDGSSRGRYRYDKIGQPGVFQ